KRDWSSDVCSSDLVSSFGASLVLHFYDLDLHPWPCLVHGPIVRKPGYLFPAVVLQHFAADQRVLHKLAPGGDVVPIPAAVRLDPQIPHHHRPADMYAMQLAAYLGADAALGVLLELGALVPVCPLGLDQLVQARQASGDGQFVLHFYSLPRISSISIWPGNTPSSIHQ